MKTKSLFRFLNYAWILQQKIKLCFITGSDIVKTQNKRKQDDVLGKLNYHVASQKEKLMLSKTKGKVTTKVK